MSARALGELPEPAAAAYAGIDADNVEPAELGDTLGHHLLQQAQIPDVSLAGNDPLIQLFDQSDRLGQVSRGGRQRGLHLVGDVRRDVVCALLSQPQGVRAALATSRAGDERDLGVYSSYRALAPQSETD